MKFDHTAVHPAVKTLSCTRNIPRLSHRFIYSDRVVSQVIYVAVLETNSNRSLALSPPVGRASVTVFGGFLWRVKFDHIALHPTVKTLSCTRNIPRLFFPTASNAVIELFHK